MKCPGQDSRYWKPGAIFEVQCPKCKNPVEFFKDDTARKCDRCGHRFVNPNMDFGCASYCEYAEQCLGTLPDELMAQKEDLLKDRVAVEVKRYLKSDFKRIGHAGRVARYAEKIGRQEGGNLAVILCAAYLHDIGIPEAERKYNSAAPEYQEKEGPPVARAILEKLKAKTPLIDEVCGIIAHHHHPKGDDTLNFKVVYDADQIANLEEALKHTAMEKDRLKEKIETTLLTQSGKKTAEATLLA
ncbi:MAG: HD domain-containing protein [Deltaproteobacteria bacterium]|nr:HD domain-containing protein [Deltaproteobacteria bacterium]MBW1954380.1 HD domain-containing protein [Deltaproteobacteria bacterium]MBW2041520.1 HD domain-containing protein [Deltaproteobacteria bacterium]MBW2131590.1 HD domain-containing protein [Deltaproteobacteria bacterium]